MATENADVGAAPYFMMVTFEISPDDEAEFNEIYDTEHIPTLMRLDGLLQVVRFRDAVPNEKGLLVYSALYLLARPNFHETAEWKAASEIGRWAPVMRPRIRSRQRRAGLVAANVRKPAG